MSFKTKYRYISAALLIALTLAAVNLSGCTFSETPDTPAPGVSQTVSEASETAGGMTSEPNTEPSELTDSSGSSDNTGTSGGTTAEPGTATEATSSSETDASTPSSTATKSTTESSTKSTTKTTTKSSTAAPTVAPPATSASTAPTFDDPPYVVGAIGDASYGVEVLENEKAVVDCSNKADGFLEIKYIAGGSSQILVIIKGPSGAQYQYTLNNGGSYETYPLNDGSGSYSVQIYRNTSGNYYAPEFSTTVSVALKSEYAPYLHASWYVYYTRYSYAVKLAYNLTKNQSGTLKKVEAVYNYVVSNISYDYAKAASSLSGYYVPDIDYILSIKKGICLDYAAVMTAMLRSLGIPTKMIFGYVDGSAYHAWINVYVNGSGWINGVIYFDGVHWRMMDPTFASSSGSNTYVPNESRYTKTKQY